MSSPNETLETTQQVEEQVHQSNQDSLPKAENPRDENEPINPKSHEPQLDLIAIDGQGTEANVKAKQDHLEETKKESNDQEASEKTHNGQIQDDNTDGQKRNTDNDDEKVEGQHEPEQNKLEIHPKASEDVQPTESEIEQGNSEEKEGYQVNNSDQARPDMQESTAENIDDKVQDVQTTHTYNSNLKLESTQSENLQTKAQDKTNAVTKEEAEEESKEKAKEEPKSEPIQESEEAQKEESRAEPNEQPSIDHTQNNSKLLINSSVMAPQNEEVQLDSQPIIKEKPEINQKSEEKVSNESVLIEQGDQTQNQNQANTQAQVESKQSQEVKLEEGKTAQISLEILDKPSKPALQLNNSSSSVSQPEVKKTPNPSQSQMESTVSKLTTNQTLSQTPKKTNAVTTSTQNQTDKTTAPAPKQQTAKPSNPQSKAKTIALSQEELRIWAEETKGQKQKIKEQAEEIDRLKKKAEYEKEGLLDRNKHLQGILDSFKDRYEKAKQNSVTLEFKNTELNKEIRKIEEEMSFYKEEVRAKFNLEIKIAELNEEIAALRAFKKNALNNDLNVRLKELQAQNGNLQKQNELISLNNGTLEKNTKKYLNLCEQRQQEITSLKTETSKVTKKCEDLMAQVGSLKKENSELESKLNAKTTALDQLKALHTRECKTFKGQIQESERSAQQLLDENANLKTELNKIIESLRRTPTSGIETGSTVQPQQNREEKIILESLVSKNKELETTIRELERESKRLKVQSETFAEKLAAKEHDFLEIVTYVCEEQDSQALKSKAKDLTDAENKRVHNAKFNKSIDDMRDLIGKVIIENIRLKRKATN